MRRSRLRRRFERHEERAARSVEPDAAEAGNADEPAHGPVEASPVVAFASVDARVMEEASQLGARLEETLLANSLLWVDIHEGDGGRSNGILVGSFQLEFTDALRLRLVRTDGSAFAEWNLEDFVLSLADDEIFGHRVVLTGRGEVVYTFPALPQEDALQLFQILSEARKATSLGPARPSGE